MMKYAVSLALVALALQVSAQPYRVRHSVDDNEVDVPVKFEVKAPWHGHADKGSPVFDGNPYKQSLVELSAQLANIAADALEDEDNVPPVIKSILKGAQKTNWKSFDEYLDYWGAAHVALLAEVEKDQQKESAPVKQASDIDGSDEEDNDDESSDE